MPFVPKTAINSLIRRNPAMTTPSATQLDAVDCFQRRVPKVVAAAEVLRAQAAGVLLPLPNPYVTTYGGVYSMFSMVEGTAKYWFVEIYSGLWLRCDIKKWLETFIIGYDMYFQSSCPLNPTTGFIHLRSASLAEGAKYLMEEIPKDTYRVPSHSYDQLVTDGVILPA